MTNYFSSLLPFVYILIYRHHEHVLFFSVKKLRQFKKILFLQRDLNIKCHVSQICRKKFSRIR